MSSMKLPASYKDPKIFNNKYIIKNQISSGSFGVVYLAFDKNTKEEVAVKLEKEENEDVCTLDREISILNRLVGVEGVPRLYWSGFEQDYNVMVISLLGHDLAHYMKQHRRFSLKSVLQLTIQLILVMKTVHQRGVIHRDLKPENILTGKAEDTSTIFLVDYGVSKVYLDSQNRHIPFKDKKSFIGTTRYASIAAHKGFELGRKDDIESLFYVMIYFLKRYVINNNNNNNNSKLPWQNLQNIGDRDRTDVVGEVKEQTEVSELCKDIPTEFADVLSYVRGLEYKSEPNYDMILNCLIKAAQNNNIQIDRVFDWSDKNQFKQLSNETLLTIQQNKILMFQNNDQKVNSGLLKPPDPKQMMPKNGSPMRQENRHSSSVSIQGSVQGSMSSMQIKYVPSQMDSNSQMQQEKISKKSTKKQVRICQANLHIQEQQPNQFDIPITKSLQDNQIRRKKTIESTWGYKEGEMDEYIGDSPKLIEKFKQLKKAQVQLQFRQLIHSINRCFKELKSDRNYHSNLNVINKK